MDYLKHLTFNQIIFKNKFQVDDMNRIVSILAFMGKSCLTIPNSKSFFLPVAK